MTQLYLISPPAFELDDFSKQLEEALSANKDTRIPLSLWERAGVRATSSTVDMPSPLIPLPGGEGNNFIGAFQLRLKNASDEQIITATKTLLPICQQHDVAFIINDRVDLCMKYDCDGVHVGQEDLLSSRRRPGPSATNENSQHNTLDPGLRRDDETNTTEAIKNIREQLGEDKALGITCHASRHLAMEAAEAGADYVAFGAFYPTTSKSMEKLEKWGTPTPDILEWWTTWTEIPCVAIGGITPENCKPLLAADFIAVITTVWNYPEGAAAAVRELHNACKSNEIE